jgi:hypothetical protein
VQRLFHKLDADKNGVLDRMEIHVPPPRLAGLFLGLKACLRVQLTAKPLFQAGFDRMGMAMSMEAVDSWIAQVPLCY